MWPWIILSSPFVLASIEQKSWVPMLVPLVLFCFGAPMHFSLRGQSGGKTGGINVALLLVVIPLIVIIFSTWRGQ